MTDALVLWTGFLPGEIRFKGEASDVKRRRERFEVTRHEAETWVVEHLGKNDLQSWLAGTEGLNIPDETVLAVETAISDEFSGDPRRWAMNFLVRGLERGQRERNWNVRPPARIVKLRLPSPALNPETFHLLPTADALRAKFLERWRADRARPLPVQAGDILFAAIAFCGLIDSRRVSGFAEHAGTTLNQHSPHSWVEWPCGPGRWDRLILDPITDALLLRWRTAGDARPLLSAPITTTALWKAINEVTPLRRHGLRSLRALLSVMQASWAFHLPPFIYQWAIGKTPSAVLPPAAFFRVLSRQRQRDGSPPADETHTETGRNPVDEHEGLAASPQAIAQLPGSEWIRTLRAIVSRKRKAQRGATDVSRALVSFADNVPAGSLPWLLAQWVTREVKSRRSGGRKLRVSSAHTFLSRIDRRLSILLGGHSPLACADTWDELLVDLAASVPPSNRGLVVNALRSFHRYLHVAHGFPPLDADLGDGAESTVDANLVTEQEFGLVRTLLARHDRSHPGVACEIVAILARRACLRRSEAHGLRICDFLGHDRLQLLVVPHRQRQLKRGASRRRVELAGLCSSEEYALVQDFVARRRRTVSEISDQLWQTPIFEDPQNPGWPVSEKRLFDPIERALRAVAGDPSLRFHHLRHSGINLHGLRIFGDIIPGISDLLEMPGQGTRDMPTRALLDVLVGGAHPIRPRLWGVAAVAGHATPQTTLESYFHLCDWVLHQFAIQTAPNLDDSLVAGLAGVSVSHLRVLRYRRGADATRLPTLIRARIPSGALEVAPVGQFAPLDMPEEGIAVAPEDRAQVQPHTICQLIALLKQRDALREQTRIAATQISSTALDMYQDRVLQASSAPKRFSTEGRTVLVIGRIRITRAWPIPGIPPSAAERIQSDSLGLALAELGRRYPRLMACWINLYLQNRYPRGHSIRLLQPVPARLWLELLQRAILRANAGLPTADERILQLMVHHAPAPRSRLNAAEQLAHWKSCVPVQATWTSTRPGSALGAGTPPYGTLDTFIRPPATADAGSKKGWGRQGGSALELGAYYAFLTLGM